MLMKNTGAFQSSFEQFNIVRGIEISINLTMQFKMFLCIYHLESFTSIFGKIDFYA